MVDSLNGTTQGVRVTQVNGATTNTLEINQRVSNTGSSSSITVRQQWSCTKAIKNFFYRIYDALCKCFSFLPKREQRTPVQQTPADSHIVQGAVNGLKEGIAAVHVWDLLKANGHYRYNTGDSSLDFLLNKHKFTNYEPVGIIWHKNCAEKIDAVMQQIKKEPDYIKNPEEYLRKAAREWNNQPTPTKNDLYRRQAVWELQQLQGKETCYWLIKR